MLCFLLVRYVRFFFLTYLLTYLYNECNVCMRGVCFVLEGGLLMVFLFYGYRVLYYIRYHVPRWIILVRGSGDVGLTI